MATVLLAPLYRKTQKYLVKEVAPSRVLSNKPAHFLLEERRHRLPWGVAALEDLGVGRDRHPYSRTADLRRAPGFAFFGRKHTHTSWVFFLFFSDTGRNAKVTFSYFIVKKVIFLFCENVT